MSRNRLRRTQTADWRTWTWTKIEPYVLSWRGLHDWLSYRLGRLSWLSKSHKIYTHKVSFCWLRNRLDGLRSRLNKLSGSRPTKTHQISPTKPSFSWLRRLN